MEIAKRPREYSDEDLAETLEAMKNTLCKDLDFVEEYMRRNGGRSPQWLFERLPRIIPQGCIELAVWKTDMHPEKIGERVVHVLLLQRPADDHYWPLEWHLPGTTNYPLDAERGDSGQAMWERLGRELHMPKPITLEDTRFAFNHFTTQAKRARGPCMHSVHTHFSDISTLTFGAGVWYPIVDLPANTIEHHVDILRKLRKLEGPAGFQS